MRLRNCSKDMDSTGFWRILGRMRQMWSKDKGVRERGSKIRCLEEKKMKKMTVNVRRHSISDKTTGEKDYPISWQGLDMAFQRGTALVIPKGGLHIYSSPKLRAIQTAFAVSQGAYFSAMQSQVTEGSVDKEFYSQYDPEIKKDVSLDSMAGYISIPDIKKKFGSMPLDDAVNLVLRESPEAVEIAGSQISMLVDRCAAEHREGLVEMVTHSPNVESGLMFYLKQAGIEVKDIKDIGGAARECDHFSLNISVEDSGVYKVEKVLYKGQEMM